MGCLGFRPRNFAIVESCLAEHSFANIFPLSYRRLLPSVPDGEGDFLFPIDLKVLDLGLQVPIFPIKT
jgi:hypothetical protein